ncbi:hypothetical protein [Streptomyces cacaoi]|uniref:hypothetical protein n=1 Tax=Streptomyces cacaoi TaxID=1898 RepID=UPI0033202464
MTPTITLARTPGESLAIALDRYRDAGGDPVLTAFDPRGHHVWPRRIAARLGVPVTGPPEAPGARQAPLGEAVAALRHARAEHLVVALLPDGGTAGGGAPSGADPSGGGPDGGAGFGHSAAVFALARNARLEIARSEDAVLRAVRRAAPRWVTLVGSADLLGFGLTTRLRARFPGVEPGVLYAHTPAKLSELVLKALLYPRLPGTEDVLVAPLLKGGAPLRSGRLTVYPQDAIDASAFARPAPGSGAGAGAGAGAGTGGADAAASSAASGAGVGFGAGAGPQTKSSHGHGPDSPGLLRMFSIITHGSEDYLRLTSRDLLCGRTGDAAQLALARRESATLPACMHGDDCVYPDARRWSPASVPAQLVFANACLTVKLGTQLFGRGNRFTVAQRFLDAWAGAYIASPLLKDGTHGENLLFHHLLEEGATVGGAVRQVNDSLVHWGIDAPEVLVVGDPEARWTADGARPLPEAVSCQETPGRAEITFEGLLPAFARVRLKDPELREAYRSGGLALTPLVPFGGRLPFYGTLGEGPDGELSALVFGFQERRLTGTEESRTLVVAPHGTRPADRIVRAVERYENLACLDIKLDKARSVLTDTANSLPAIARRARDAAGELTRSEPLAKATDRVLANCARLDRHLLETLLRLTETREYHFVESYRPAYAVRHVESPYAACRYCPETTHRYTSAHVLRPRLRRLLVSCPVCGATQDTEDETVDLTLEGEAVLVPGGTTRLRVRLANRGPDALDVLLGARITRGKQHGFGFALDPGRLRVPAGSTAEAALTVTTGHPTTRHAMLLRCYAVGEGRIDFAGRDLRFAPHAMDAPAEPAAPVEPAEPAAPTLQERPHEH